jgi:hypothetical protein
MKISIDGEQFVNMPNFRYKPEMVSIGATASERISEVYRAIKNIRIEGISATDIALPEPELWWWLITNPVRLKILNSLRICRKPE